MIENAASEYVIKRFSTPFHLIWTNFQRTLNISASVWVKYLKCSWDSFNIKDLHGHYELVWRLNWYGKNVTNNFKWFNLKIYTKDLKRKNKFDGFNRLSIDFIYCLFFSGSMQDLYMLLSTGVLYVVFPPLFFKCSKEFFAQNEEIPSAILHLALYHFNLTIFFWLWYSDRPTNDTSHGNIAQLVSMYAIFWG